MSRFMLVVSVFLLSAFNMVSLAGTAGGGSTEWDAPYNSLRMDDMKSPSGTLSNEGSWADYYAAISYSPSTGISGRSWDWSTRERAEDVANGYCNVSDCRVVVWVKNGCAALAVSNANRGSWAYGWSSTRASANSLAQGQCFQSYGPCTLKTSVCTTR